MIDERFSSSSAGWYTKYLHNIQQVQYRIRSHLKRTHMCENLLRQPPPFTLIKCLVETQNTTTAFQTVTGHLQLVHGVHILYMKLNARSIGRFRSPHIKILMTPSLEV